VDVALHCHLSDTDSLSAVSLSRYSSNVSYRMVLCLVTLTDL